MRKLLTVLCALAISVAVSSAAFAATLGAVAVKDIQGKEFKTETLKGKKSILIFVQAACGQCRSEISEVKDKAADLAKKGDIYFVVVDVNVERATEYFKSKELPGVVLMDPSFSIGDSIDVGATPATVVVDKDLNIVKSKVGFKTGDIDRLIKEL